MNQAQTPLHELLQKEVSRKEFLQVLGAGAASLLGLSAILKLAGYKGHNLLSGAASRGYGSNPYGR